VARSNEDLDALAALSYLDVNDEQQPGQGYNERMKTTAPLRPYGAERAGSSGAPGERVATPPAEFKSSFAPSKQAAERKAKLEAQQAAHNAAVHRPGRANGRKKSKVANQGAWGESSDEEEEEEEEEEDDDDDADSDVEPSQVNRQPTPTSGPGSANNHGMRGGQPGFAEDPQYSHLRPPRTLPQIPHRPSGACFHVSCRTLGDADYAIYSRLGWVSAASAVRSVF
jgi:CCR4-NOT transcriptional complex subunit CAF120